MIYSHLLFFDTPPPPLTPLNKQVKQRINKFFLFWLQTWHLLTPIYKPLNLSFLKPLLFAFSKIDIYKSSTGVWLMKSLLTHYRFKIFHLLYLFSQQPHTFSFLPFFLSLIYKHVFCLPLFSSLFLYVLHAFTADNNIICKHHSLWRFLICLPSPVPP